MVLDPIPQSLPVHFFGSRPQPPTSHGSTPLMEELWIQNDNQHLRFKYSVLVPLNEEMCDWDQNEAEILTVGTISVQIYSSCGIFSCWWYRVAWYPIMFMTHLQNKDDATHTQPRLYLTWHPFMFMTHLHIIHSSSWYRVAKTHRMHYLYRSFSAKEPYNFLSL